MMHDRSGMNPAKWVAKLSVMLVLALLGTAPSVAHEQKEGPNGGPFVDINGTHVELVLTASRIRVFLSDNDDAPIDVAGGSGNAIVLAGTAKSIAKLAPTENNTLGAGITVATSGPYKVVLIISLKGQAPIQARFELEALALTQSERQTRGHLQLTSGDDTHGAEHDGHDSHTSSHDAKKHKGHGSKGHESKGHDTHAAHGYKSEAATVAVHARHADTFAANRPVNVKLHLVDKKSGQALGPEALKIAHTRPIHLLIADPSLDDYIHAHPTPGEKPGEWIFSFTPKHNRTYRVWADIVPEATGKQEFARFRLNAKAASDTAIQADTVTHATIGDIEMSLDLDRPLTVGKASTARLTISKSNQPFNVLQPVMGAFAHMVGFADDRKTIMHVHPLGREPSNDDETGGPVLEFHIVPNRPGVTRFWAQVRINGEDVYAPFTLTVAEGA